MCMWCCRHRIVLSKQKEKSKSVQVHISGLKMIKNIPGARDTCVSSPVLVLIEPHPHRHPHCGGGEGGGDSDGTQSR
jgi:hypothetical protein